MNDPVTDSGFILTGRAYVLSVLDSMAKRVFLEQLLKSMFVSLLTKLSIGFVDETV